MEYNMKFSKRATSGMRPSDGRRFFTRCLTVVMVAGLLLGAPRAYAAQVGVPAGGVTLAAGSTTVISSATVFPLKILANGTYIIQGSYSGDYGLPCGYSGAAITATQAAERKAPVVGPAGMISAAALHGIYVGAGLKDVTIVLINVGLQTTSATTAALIIDGYNGDASTVASTYQDQPAGSNVVIQLPAGTKSFLYSCRAQASGNRAGIEVWKGSTVYIEGEGSLLAKSADSRNYSGNNNQPRRPDDAHPQGSPYWTGVYATGSPPTGSSMWEVQANGGAAGIGSGNIAGSGGNVVIRGNPTVIAISGAHGAGIGGGWATSGASGSAYKSDILIYGGTVESWGGMHGAGIGGGCYGGIGTIVVLPTASVYSASYDQPRAMLGQMSTVVFFGNPADSRLAVYTEDYREVDMFLDMSKNAAVRAVIERLGGGMNPSNLPLGKTRNNWPVTGTDQHRPNYTDWAASTVPAIQQGADKYVLLLNGGFVPSNIDLAFLTAAKTEKNHPYNPVATTSDAVQYRCYMNTTTPINTYGLNYPSPLVDPYYNTGSQSATHYAYSTPAARPVPRFVMIAPTYDPSVALTPTTPPNLYVAYLVTQLENKVTLTIGNLGNQKLYNPSITIIGDDYELIASPGTPLQTAVNTALAGLLSTDAGGPFIPVGTTFSLDVRLKVGKSPGTSYDGWVLFSADDLPDAPKPIQFNINVIDKIMPPPDLVMHTPTDTVVSGPFQIRAKFKSATNVYPHYVQNLTVSDVFVDYGTVTNVAPDPATVDMMNPGYYSDWIISITPTGGLPNLTTISTHVKQNAAEDLIGAKTQTVSKPKLVTFSSSGPYVLFNVTEGAVLTSLDTLIVYFNGNSITAGKGDSIYINGIGQFTATGGQASLRSSLTLTRLPSTSLSLSTPGQYVLTVVDKNNLKIGSPITPVIGFPNGDYELTIPPTANIRNYDGNYLANTTLHFSIQKPEVLDGTGQIVPPVLGAPGGTVRIWVEGVNLLAAKGKLIIVIRDPIPGYSVGQEIYIPAANFTDTTAYIDIVLPPNMTLSPELYDFTIRLLGRQPPTDVTPDLTATVTPAGATIDTTATSLGYREGLHAYPNRQNYEGGAVDLKVVGKNMFHLNTAPNSNLHIRVKKNGVYTTTVIPVPTPATLGAAVIPLGLAYTTEKNLSFDDDVYVYELWYYVSGVLTAVPEHSTGLPYIADSTIVKSGIDELIQAVKNTHHVVAQRVANTPPTVRTWLVPQLNAIQILRDFGLTVEEGDISFTDFDAAIEGSMSNPTGMDGYFIFTLTLRTAPAIEITLNTGEIIPDRFPAVHLEREVIVPEVSGYLTDPLAGDHHVESGSEFTFYLVPTNDGTRILVPKVTTDRKIGSDAETVTVESKDDGSYYIVTISAIREPIQVYINGVGDSPGAIESPAELNVWGEKGILHIRAIASGQAIVYNTVGRVAATVSLKAGETSRASLSAGVYIVSINGVSYKALVK